MTPPARRTLRAVVYVRLSSHDGANDPSTSPQRQEQSCRAQIEAKGWTLATGVGDAGIIRDLDVTGSDKGLRLNRPGLETIRRHWPDVDVVVFAKLDRLARNVIDFRAFAEEAERNGAALVSVAESLDLTTPSGRFVATILAAFAEMEAATIAERTRAGVDQTRRNGRWKGGAPFGMRLVKATDPAGYILAPDPETAPVVRDMADAVLAGTPIYKVAADLNARGILTQGQRVTADGRGHRKTPAAGWSATTVRRLLLNPGLIGRTVHRGELLRDPETGLPARVWDPVLSDEQHRRLTALLTSAQAPTGRQERSRLLTGGIARCAQCSAPLYASAKKRDGDREQPIYVCSTRRNGGECGGVAIDATGLENMVERELLARFGHVHRFHMITETVDDGERADIEAALVDLSRKMTAPGADVMALASQVVTLQARRDALPATVTTVRRETLSGRVADAYSADDTTAARRALLADYIPTVLIGPGVRGRHGFDEGRVRLVTIDDIGTEIDLTDGAPGIGGDYYDLRPLAVA
jgi:DNA invertase Pin-like site-specific DNA recombinase